MTNRYPSYKVILSDNQKVKLAKAYQDKSPIALRLSKGELIGNNEMMLTKTQLKKIQRQWHQVLVLSYKIRGR